jgi:hypothetical protein
MSIRPQFQHNRYGADVRQLGRAWARFFAWTAPLGSLAKEVQAGEEFEIPQVPGFIGTMLLVPPERK